MWKNKWIKDPNNDRSSHSSEVIKKSEPLWAWNFTNSYWIDNNHMNVSFQPAYQWLGKSVQKTDFVCWCCTFQSCVFDLFLNITLWIVFFKRVYEVFIHRLWILRPSISQESTLSPSINAKLIVNSDQCDLGLIPDPTPDELQYYPLEKFLSTVLGSFLSH